MPTLTIQIKEFSIDAATSVVPQQGEGTKTLALTKRPRVWCPMGCNRFRAPADHGHNVGSLSSDSNNNF